MHSWTLPEDKSREIIKYALDNGINFFDTAMAYQGGTSEEFLGRAIKDFAKREDVVIATKFSPRTQKEIDDGITGQQHVRNCLEAQFKTFRYGLCRFIYFTFLGL
ncbi:aldo/keto reductase [Coprobacillaceae bacterium CR2/5/TPMF4]|nr:aldo/keto reductase [Coprobacillaceae bacterium CR2/5/TPMF4]